MAQNKKKRQKRKNRNRMPGDLGPAVQGGGGMMQSMVGGFRAVLGAGEKKERKKTSRTENIVWGVILAGLLVYVIYTYTK